MKKAIRVLIADDSQPIRERLLTLLSELEDVEVVGAATNGAEALDLFRDLRPDVLILDIWMPERNGLEVLETIRREDQSSSIIMLTTDASTQHHKKSLQAGANHFLHKSKDFEKLPDILQEFKSVGT